MPTSEPDRALDNSGLQEIRVRRVSPATGTRDAFQDLRVRLRQTIAAEMTPSLDRADMNQLRPFVHGRVNELLNEQSLVLNRAEKRQLLEAIVVDLSTS